MKKASKKKKSAKTVTALAVVAPAAPIEKRDPWVLQPEQVALLKRTVAKGTTDDEFALFLWVAKKHHLDPMTRQLHCVKRFSTALNTEVMSIQVGIDGYRSMAARYPDFGAIEEPEYELEPDGKTLLLARVRVWKKGFEHPTVAVAYWREYVPDLAKSASFMWKKMPRLMLGKVAEALALRKAWPDLSDIYTDEEMEQANDRNAPSGREISSASEPTNGSREAAQQVAQRKIAEAAQTKSDAPVQTITKAHWDAFLETARQTGWKPSEISAFLERHNWEAGRDIPFAKLEWLMNVAMLGEDRADELIASRTRP